HREDEVADARIPLSRRGVADREHLVVEDGSRARAVEDGGGGSAGEEQVEGLVALGQRVGQDGDLDRQGGGAGGEGQGAGDGRVVRAGGGGAVGGGVGDGDGLRGGRGERDGEDGRVRRPGGVAFQHRRVRNGEVGHGEVVVDDVGGGLGV